MVSGTHGCIKKYLLAHLHLLPAPVQADVKFLPEKFDAAICESEELNRNVAVQNKVEDLPNEEWRDIAGYEGIYMVSNMGRVKSFYGIGERLLTPGANRGGYMYVVLTKDKVRKSRKVHTLVGRAFLPNPENKPLVHHRDTNRGNNLLSNLKWATHQENNNYAAQMGSYAKEKGCASPKAKFDRVSGNGDGRAADCQAERETRDEHYFKSGSRRATECRKEKYNRQRGDVCPASLDVSEFAAAD